MRLFAISCLLLLLSTLAFAQPQDSLQVEEFDTLGIERQEAAIKYKTKSGLKPNRLHLGIDLYPLVATAVERDFIGATIHAGMSFSDRFWLQADIGYEQSDRRTSAYPFYSFMTNGLFTRLGIDYNLTYWKVPRDAFLFGLHFGYASFAQELQYSSTNQVWRHLMEKRSAAGIGATWVEPRATLQVRSFERLSLEAVLGLRIRTGLGEYAVFPNEIPGLGVLKSRARLSFGYRLCYALDFDDR